MLRITHQAKEQVETFQNATQMYGTENDTADTEY